MTMERIMRIRNPLRRTYSRALLAIAMLATALPCAATGLWDPGFQNGTWRSDFDRPGLGTLVEPLNYAPVCRFPAVPFALCPTNFAVWPGISQLQPARWFARDNWVGLADPGAPAWVVGANTEPTLNAACNSGPPNQSEAIAAPFEDVYGLSIDADHAARAPWRRALSLAVDLSHRPRQLADRPQCVPGEFIPYLGFGASSERSGNGQPLAWIGAATPAPLLLFNLRLLDSNAALFDPGEPAPSRPRGQHAGVWIEAQWNGTRRWIWIDLINAYDALPLDFVTPWNWAIPQSFHFPGAEIVFTSGARLREACGSTGLDLPELAPGAWADGQPRALQIDIARLFQCLGDRFADPLSQQTAAVPITGIHFFVEVGVRELDGVPGLGEADYDSRLGIVVDSLDLIDADRTALYQPAAWVAQMGRDFTGRAWTNAETATWLALLAREGRVPTTRAMLRSQAVARGLGAVARLQLIAFGEATDRASFNAMLALAQSGGSPAALAERLIASAPFQQRYAGLDDRGYVGALIAQALGESANDATAVARLARAIGSNEYWVQAIGSGRAGRTSLLLALVRYSQATGLRESAVDTLALYRAMLGGLPDAGGLDYWTRNANMPEQLIEALHYAPPYRARINGGNP
jgi:hypothetical protein